MLRIQLLHHAAALFTLQSLHNKLLVSRRLHRKADFLQPVCSEHACAPDMRCRLLRQLQELLIAFFVAFNLKALNMIQTVELQLLRSIAVAQKILPSGSRAAVNFQGANILRYVAAILVTAVKRHGLPAVHRLQQLVQQLAVHRI